MKTLLVGWDSVPWSFVQPLLERGELPHLQGLMDNGWCGSVRSTMPAVTPVAWSSIITGKLPQKHGIYDWVWRDGDQIRVAASSEIRGTPFWRRLNDAGLRVGLVNVPLTFPATPIDGFMLCGFGAPPPPANITYPTALLDDIQARFGAYTPALSTQETAALGEQQAIYRAEREIQARQVEIAAYLVGRYPVDVLAINLMLFDHTNHRAKTWELVEQSLRDLDEHLGRLLAAFQPDSVILFGDHGARRLRGQFLLGDWLCAHGYMARRRRDNQSPQEFNFLLQQYLQQGRKLHGAFERAVRSALRRGFRLAPRSVQERFWLDVHRLAPKAYEHYWLLEEIDHESSSVLDVRNIGTVYLKRQPEAGDAVNTGSDVKARLMRELAMVTDPETQTPVFEDVYDADTLYGATPAGSPPDLILNYHESGLALRREMGIGLLERFPFFAYSTDNPSSHVWVWHGDHAPDGICVFCGGTTVDTVHPENLSIVDIPAILLHLYQVPIPEDFDGEVRPVFNTQIDPIEKQPGDTFPNPHPIRKEDLKETEDVLDRLRALGYVD